MEDECAHCLGVGESMDLLPLFIMSRVTARGEHDTDSRAVLPTDGNVGESSVRTGTHDRYEITVEKRKHDLRLGITEPRIELHDLRAIRRHHQAKIETAAIGTSFLRHGGDGRL